MDGSNRSAVSQSLSHKRAATHSREESGWTEYLEDFMASEGRETTGGSSSSADAGGSSLVSDAASSVLLPWKAPPASFPLLQGSGGLKRLIERRARLGNDELEDTASSPVSSPKVKNLNRFDVKRDDVEGIPQEKGLLLAAGGKLSEEQRRSYDQGTSETDFGDQRRSNRMKLKKKGSTEQLDYVRSLSWVIN